MIVSLAVVSAAFDVAPSAAAEQPQQQRLPLSRLAGKSLPQTPLSIFQLKSTIYAA